MRNGNACWRSFIIARKKQEVKHINSKDKDKERVIIAALKVEGYGIHGFDHYLEELRGLVEAAGGQVIATLVQARRQVESATYLGRGKVEELKHLVQELEPDTVVFDRELSPVQLRNLEQLLDIKILDRTILILDIFAQRARSREGQLQVELAMLQYRLPRLRGSGTQLSRLGAGIGTRGAGEQKLELDRRYIRGRIQEIKRQMARVESTRALHRKQRQRSGIKTLSLVGYTNAGKSSLFNALCSIAHKSGSGQVEADERLFQTLDTTTRRIDLGGGQKVLITDTVGFIQDLPPALVAAFHSTLEEAIDADLLLHVVDISDPNYLDKIGVVEKVLEELGAEKDRIITVFNKVDLLKDYTDTAPKGSIYLSARSGQGLEDLMGLIVQRLQMDKSDCISPL
jgi:GTP-binding protein HflX